MDKIILIENNLLIYDFNESGSPRKWINLPQFAKATLTIAAPIIILIMALALWKYAETNLIITFAQKFG